MSAAQLVQTIVVLCIGGFWSVFVLCRSLWLLATKGSKFLQVKQRDSPPKDLQNDSYGTHHYIKLKEVKLHYVAKGAEDKPLMLCLHGFPEFWYSWRYQLKEFSNDYRVVAVDMRGYGDSDKPSGKAAYTMTKLTGDIKELIPALGYSKAVVVAHDWGGAVAWSFAMKYPEMVEKLINCNIPHPKAMRKFLQKSWKQFLMSWYMFFFQLPYLPEWFLRTGDLAMFSGIAKQMKPGTTSEEDTEVYKYIFSRPGAFTGPINYYRAALQSPPERGINPKITTLPVLLIWGNKDTALATEMAAMSGEYCSNFTLKYVDNTSHWVQQEEPKIVNQYMWEFLKE